MSSVERRPVSSPPRGAARQGGSPRPLSSIALLVALVATSAIDARDPIVFVSRQLDEDSGASRESVVRRARSGRLLRLDSDDQVVPIVDGATTPGAPTDVMDPDPSPDGTRLVFSGWRASDGGWRIWEVGVDGTGLRRITDADRDLDLSRFGENAARLAGHDDLDPCWLPDGRICFVSTRYPGLAPDGRHRTTNLYVVEADGSDLHRITTERFGADTPTVDPTTGKIIYSRWWRTAQGGESGNEEPEPIPPGSPGYGGGSDPSTTPISPEVLRSVADDEFPGVNSWFLASIAPDGTDMRMHSGVGLDRQATQAWKPSVASDGRVLALFIPQTPVIGEPGPNGIRRFAEGALVPQALGGPQSFGSIAAQALPPELIDLIRELGPDAAGIFPEFDQLFVYQSIVELSRTEALVSATPLQLRDADVAGISTDFDLYIQDIDPSLPRPLLALEGTAEMDAVVVRPRAVPPVLADRVHDRLSEDVPQTIEAAAEAAGTFRFVVENIHHNPPVNRRLVGSPPVGKQLAIEFWMAPQGPSTTGADEPVLIRSEPIPPSGRVEVELPAGVPLFELLRRPDGTIAQGRDGQIYHVAGMNFGRAGEEARCVGCHAGHSMVEVPTDETALRYTNLAPSAVVSASSVRTLGFPGMEDGRDPADDPNAAGEILIDPIFPEFPGMFRPETVVDRSTLGISSSWAAASEDRSELTLRWSVPLHAREVALWATPREGGVLGERDVTIHAFTVSTELFGESVETLRVARVLRDGNTVRVALDSERPFDSLSIAIDRSDLEGVFEGELTAALAEVEVIARPSDEITTPSVSVRRGDSDCSGAVDLSDAIVTLTHLFSGRDSRAPALCCEVAADVNADDEVNISDPIAALNWLFLGGPEPAAPGPRECGPTRAGSLFCEIETCR